LARPIVMPSTGMYTAEGKLLNWLRPNGAAVASGDAVAEVETEKSVFEIEAPEGGILQQVADVGSTVVVEGLMGYILSEGEPLPAQPATELPQANPPKSAPAPRITGEIRVSPLAKRLAAEHGLDLSQVVGTGPAGRIVEADILAAAGQRKTKSPATSPSTELRIRERVPLSGMRRTIADRLRHSLSAAASLTLTREVRAGQLVALRESLRKTGVEAPYDAIFIKLLAAALREHPAFNSYLENDAIVILEDVNIGFAVAVAGGLIVPVVRHADSQPLINVAVAVRDLSSRARDGRLRPADVAHATASITNLGSYGVDGFTPILNPPQSVILGIGRIVERPVVENGRVLAVPTAVLSLTFDHRVADGAPAAQLLGFIAERIKDRQYLESLAEA
jgi:pyruvate dehydrogenase E2 component (dihydrolipoyllysine-residue acetyltransferase)